MYTILEAPSHTYKCGLPNLSILIETHFPSYSSIPSARTFTPRTAITAPTRRACFQRATAAGASLWSCGRSTRAVGRRMLSTRTLRRRRSNKWRRRLSLEPCKDFDAITLYGICIWRVIKQTCICPRFVQSLDATLFLGIAIPRSGRWIFFIC